MRNFIADLYQFADGYLEIRTLPDGVQKYFPLDDIEGIEKYALSRGKNNVYFGVSTRDGNGGSKDNVVEIPAVWVDIDFKDSNEETATKLLVNSPIMPSYVVRSGGGFHCYWKLSEPLGKDDMEEIEAVMMRLVDYYGGDSSGAEIARILRVPKTYNYKMKKGEFVYNPQPLITYKKTSDQTFELSDFDIFPERERQEQTTVIPINHDVILNKIMSCDFMAHCQNDAATLTEPEWFAMISQLAGKKGGRDLIHHLSKPYPGYSRHETDQKILSTINDGAPMSCRKIKNIWGGECNCGAKNPASRPYQLPNIELDNHNVTDVTDVTRSHDLSRTCHANVTLYPENENSYDGNLSEAIREYVEETTGYFTGVDVDRELGIPRQQAATRRKILSRLCKEKAIKRDRNNKYIKNIVNIEFIDTNKINDERFSITLPLGLSDLVQLPPKSIMVVAGSSNAGKTAVLLHLLRENLKTQDELLYLMSEMGPQEYVNRVRGICTNDIDWKRWNRTVKAADISTDYAAAISTYAPNGISVVDFLEEVDGEYFKIASSIRNIYDGLEDGVAVVAIQKHTEAEYGRGGQATSEKARLYLTIDKVAENDDATLVALKIIKAKSYIDRNPNGKEIHLKITRGSRIDVLSDWVRVSKEERIMLFDKYKHESDGDRRARMIMVS